MAALGTRSSFSAKGGHFREEHLSVSGSTIYDAAPRPKKDFFPRVNYHRKGSLASGVEADEDRPVLTQVARMGDSGSAEVAYILADMQRVEPFTVAPAPSTRRPSKSSGWASMARTSPR